MPVGKALASATLMSQPKPRMLLAREFIGYLARQITKQLSPKVFETSDLQTATGLIAEIIEEDLSVEDKLNDEVRELLSQYADYMRREGVGYQDMFRKIKNQLVAQRKIIRASGRDTGDQMKLSREKVNDLSHRIVTAMRTRREFRVKGDSNVARLELVRVMTETLLLEERVDKAARQKVKTIKRDIPEGGEEWDVLHKRFYAEEMKKLGIDLAR